MEYSQQELRAIFAIVMAMAKVDGRIDENEQSYIEQIKNKLGLTQEDVDATIAHADSEAAALALLILAKMNSKKKANLKQMLKQMITIDNEINENEVALYDFVCNIAGLDNNDQADDVDFDPTNLPDVE